MRARLKPEPSVKPKWKAGDRVLMLKDSDGMTDIRGRLIREGRPFVHLDGSTRLEYVMEFDESHSDLTDDPAEGIRYSGTTVLEEFLRPLT